MNFLKHVGKHGDRKVCVLFRQVPQEDHMCLVVYPEVLPAPWEDAIMKVIESDVGQQAAELSDALHRNYFPDGRVILQTLHAERMIKKIRTGDVIMTPRPDSTIRLDELNKMLNEMKTGEDAIKRMAENDAARGMVEPGVKRSAEAEFKAGRRPVPAMPSVTATDGVVSNRELAKNLLAQAQRMESEAKGLVDEAARMKKEAAGMDPSVPETVNAVVQAIKPKRGRPSMKSLFSATTNAAQ